MVRKRRSFASLVMAALLLAACGKSEKPKEEKAPEPPSVEPPGPAPDEAQKIIDEQLDAVQAKDAARFPCSLFTQQEIEALIGNPLDRGNYTSESVTEDDHSYEAVVCSWDKMGEPNSARFAVSLPKHFKSGKVECPPGGQDKKLPGLGDRASWAYEGSYGMGDLRACSAKAMVVIRVFAKGKDEATNLKIARTLAEKGLAGQP